MKSNRRTMACGQYISLGIEAGGTRTSVLLVDADDKQIIAFESGPAVLSLMSDRELQWHLRDIAVRLPQTPSAIGIGMAGARSEADKERLQRAASRIWPEIPCIATNDLETALATAPARKQALPRVLVLSGTGSCCFGRSPDGRTAKVGGRGHVIGDRASACDIGLRALRAIIADLDHHGRLGPLGGAILHALLFTEPEQLISWSVIASKSQIASLAVTVFAIAAKGDPLAKKLLSDAAEMLAEDACACAHQLLGSSGPVEFILNGGVILKNPAFMRDVSRRLKKAWPQARVMPLVRSSVWGGVELARQAASVHAPVASVIQKSASDFVLPEEIADLAVLAASPTEMRNPRSMGLDQMPLGRGIDLMLVEDASLMPAIRSEKKAITQVIAEVIRAFESGGRLFYAGAGTSGRLGVLDASEIPPTFRAPREQVQGIIAGGQQALWSAVEGAEDDVQAGVLAIRHRAAGAKDVVIGIAASGRTPFVWGALHEARARGAFTVLLCFNPAIRQAVKRLRDPSWKPDLLIIPNVGPEVLTGSTRLKSGTATKLVLNMITTLAMTKVGKVVSNLMVDVNPSNVKLRDRALRILCDLTGCNREEARSALNQSGWTVKKAYESL
ncbi:MAG: N-acetylmuramic acid 6-phosphate etherase [Prosthecobacter sp.]